MPPRSSSGNNSAQDESTLVHNLNVLLSSLNIPINLISPTDLTPGLLIAILESILGLRLPMVDRKKQTKNSKTSKTRNMKIFLGVLETDILKTDVGLSDVDPANSLMGELMKSSSSRLLCWMAEHMDLSHDFKQQQDDETYMQEAPSDFDTFETQRSSLSLQRDIDAKSVFQMGSTVTAHSKASQSNLSLFTNQNGGSVTSIDLEDLRSRHDIEDSYSNNESDILSSLSPFGPTFPPTYTHEIPSSSLLFSTDFQSTTHQGHLLQLDTPSIADSSILRGLEHSLRSSISSVQSDNLTTSVDEAQEISTYKHGRTLSRRHPIPVGVRLPVRYDGYIESADEDFEIASYEHSRSISFDQSVRNKGAKKRRSVKIDSVKEQYALTQDLLNERAKLLNQLAELKRTYR